MSLFANLYLGDNASGTYTNTYRVVQCEVKVSRHHNSYTPDDNPRCDQLILSVIAPGKTTSCYLNGTSTRLHCPAKS